MFASPVTMQICTYYSTPFTRNNFVFGRWNFALIDSDIICFYIPYYSGNYKIYLKNNWIFILGWLCVIVSRRLHLPSKFSLCLCNTFFVLIILICTHMHSFLIFTRTYAGRYNTLHFVDILLIHVTMIIG